MKSFFFGLPVPTGIVTTVTALSFSSNAFAFDPSVLLPEPSILPLITLGIVGVIAVRLRRR